MLENIQSINKSILLYLNSFTEFPIIWKIVYIMADAPIFLIPIFLVVAWIVFLKNEKKKHDLLYLFYSCLVAISISIIIQQFVHLERPEDALRWASNMILSHIPDASFPSDHASVSIAFLTSLFLFWFKKSFFIILPLFVIMNLSRVIWWVHWPFDILAWSIVWIFSWFLVYKLRDLTIFKVINENILKIANIFKL